VTIDQASEHQSDPIFVPDQSRRPANPSLAVLIGLAAFYLAGLAALLFWPGATFLDRLRQLDGGVCAQQPTHTFVVDSVLLPLCARCTGMYLGFAVTGIVLAVTRRISGSQMPTRPVLLVLGGLVAIMGVDGINSTLRDLGMWHPYTPLNPVRLATGLGTGVAMAAILFPVVNSVLWHYEDPQRSFGSLTQLAWALPALVLAFVAVVAHPDWLLYPISVLSSAGLWAELALINLIFMLALTGRLNRYFVPRQILVFVTIALVFAVLELFGLNALKEWATHSLLASIAIG
jgi:uncharacterized membrane protein